jgi:hypothetical protein
MSLWNLLFGTPVPFTAETITQLAKDPEALSAISEIAASWNKGLYSNKSLNFIDEDRKIDETLIEDVLKQKLVNKINTDIDCMLGQILNAALNTPSNDYWHSCESDINKIIADDHLVLELQSPKNPSEIRTYHDGVKEIAGDNGAVPDCNNLLDSNS